MVDRANGDSNEEEAEAWNEYEQMILAVDPEAPPPRVRRTSIEYLQAAVRLGVFGAVLSEREQKTLSTYFTTETFTSDIAASAHLTPSTKMFDVSRNLREKFHIEDAAKLKVVGGWKKANPRS